MKDFELLLFSWVQMLALDMVVPSEEYRNQQKSLENQLKQEYGITSIELVGKTLEEYAIAYQIQNEDQSENQMIRFDADEVESIYDMA